MNSWLPVAGNGKAASGLPGAARCAILQLSGRPMSWPHPHTLDESRGFVLSAAGSYHIGGVIAKFH